MMNRYYFRLTIAIVLCFGFQYSLNAQEKKDPDKESAGLGQKEKAAIKANFKKLEIDKYFEAETPDLYLCGTIPEKNLQAGSALLQKQYALIIKSLNFTDRDNIFKGKLIIYVFGEKREYSSFSRIIRQKRPDSSASYSYNITGDDSFIDAFLDRKNPDFSAKSEVSEALSLAMLDRKIGSGSVPSWFKVGFREVISMKLEPKLLAAHRQSVRTLLAKKGDKPITAKFAWDNDLDNQRLIGTSVVDFLISGPPAKKISDFLSGFQKSEDRPNPTMIDALKGIDLNEEKLDKAWKTWVRTGK